MIGMEWYVVQWMLLRVGFGLSILASTRCQRYRRRVDRSCCKDCLVLDHWGLGNGSLEGVCVIGPSRRELRDRTAVMCCGEDPVSKVDR